MFMHKIGAGQFSNSSFKHGIVFIYCVANVIFLLDPYYMQLAECLAFNSKLQLSYCTCRYSYEISHYICLCYKFSTEAVCRGGINNIKGSLSDGNESIPEGLRAEIRQIQPSEP